MDELTKKLEAATEGSRELDADIYMATHGVSEGSTKPATPPHFTTSIDAALTLVPEGWIVHMELHPSPADEANISLHDGGDKTTLGQADFDQPALALCIAALKARME